MIKFEILKGAPVNCQGIRTYYLDTILLGGKNSILPDLHFIPEFALYIEEHQLKAVRTDSQSLNIKNQRLQISLDLKKMDIIELPNMEIQVIDFKTTPTLTLSSILNTEFEKIKDKSPDFLELLKKVTGHERI